MPILKTQRENDSILWGIWNITEPLDLFEYAYREFLPNPRLDKIKVVEKKRQSLACRLLIKHMRELYGHKYYGLTKDENSKPSLVADDAFISVSHSSQLAVAIVNSIAPTGIDIERINPKIAVVADRVLNPHEIKIANGDLNKLTLIWCAKEAIYKMYGKRSLFFREDIRILDLEENGHMHACLLDGEAFPMRYEFHQEFVICYTLNTTEILVNHAKGKVK